MIDDKSAGRRRVLAGALSLTMATLLRPAMGQQPVSNAAAATAQPGVVKPSEMVTLMPEKVFYRGQSATVQIRNSGGVRWADGMLALAALVDTSGYSTGVQQRYQAYFITEVPLKFGEEKLAPGAYGVGFVEGEHFVVMDVGDHELLHAVSHRDAELRRPTPLQVVAATQPETYRLYAGRSYVEFRRAQ